MSTRITPSQPVFICMATLCIAWHCADSSLAQQKPAAKIRISKTTTFLTKPLRKDGFVDYVAGINTEMRKGVTPRNNAAALLAETMGPSVFSESIRKQFFSRMGIPVPPDQGNYFLSMSRFARLDRPRNQASIYASRLIKEQSAGSSRLWTRRELPALAAWLDANQQPLSRVLEATGREKWYCPVVIADEDFDGILLAALMPLPQEIRSIVRALSCRALLAVREGRIDDAQRDLLACHRLARHVGQGFSLIDVLVGYAVESLACQTEVLMLQSGRLTIKQLNAYRQSLDTLQPLSTVARKIDFGERLIVLDSVRYVQKHRVKGLKSLTELSANSGAESFQLLNRNMDLIDWNIVMTMVNQEFDRVLEAVTKPTFGERRQAIARLTARFKQIGADIRARKTLEDITKGGKIDGAKISDLMGRLFIGLFLPASHVARRAEDRAAAYLSMSRVAVALELSRKTNRRFPRALAALAPRFLKHIPKDSYSGQEMRYRPTANGYLLYCVGDNQKDDGGRTFNSRPAGDDIVIRVRLSR